MISFTDQISKIIEIKGKKILKLNNDILSTQTDKWDNINKYRLDLTNTKNGLYDKIDNALDSIALLDEELYELQKKDIINKKRYIL